MDLTILDSPLKILIRLLIPLSPLGFDLAQHLVRLLNLHELLLCRSTKIFIFNFIRMVLAGQLPPHRGDFGLRSRRTNSQHLVRILLPIGVHRVYNLFPNLRPPVVLGKLNRVRDGLLQIRPPGRSDEVMDRFVHWNFIAIRVGDRAVEVEEASPEREVQQHTGNDYGGTSKNG